MSTAGTQRDAHDEDAAKSNFEIYRSGGTTRDIRLTINLVIVARRWRSLLGLGLRASSALAFISCPAWQ